MNPLREKIEYLLTKGFFLVLRRCPEAVIYGACGLVASLVYRLGAKRRRITMNNLKIAFPEKTLQERKRIARAAYTHFGRLIAESAMILAGKITREKLLNMVDGEQMQKLRDLEAATDKGILFISGHLGNFELLAHYTGLRCKKGGYVVARQGNNRRIDEKIVKPMRESFGNQVVYKSRALPRIARALRSGLHAGLLVDIRANKGEGVPVRFFGKKTLALKSSAYLQLKLGMPVVPLTLVRTDTGRYRLIVSEPVLWKNDDRPAEEQIAELTQIHQTALEKLIRQYPEQWLWMHNRWKFR
jgi:Kdo2-lipid IVA lauroyltransferase/acyltransferase